MHDLRAAWSVDRYSSKGWLGFAAFMAMLAGLAVVQDVPILGILSAGYAVLCLVQAVRSRSRTRALSVAGSARSE